MERVLVPGPEGALRVFKFPRKWLPVRVFVEPLPRGDGLDPDAVVAALRDAVRAWEDVVSPGVPSFAFTDTAESADVQVGWEETSFDGSSAADGWTEARSSWAQRVAVRIEHAYEAEEGYAALRRVVMHEIGHILGLAGHSPHRGDVMYFMLTNVGSHLSVRDRTTLRVLYACPDHARWSDPLRDYHPAMAAEPALAAVYERYPFLPSPRALAFAWEGSGRWAVGYSYEAESPEAAALRARERCDETRAERGIAAPCVLYAVDEKVVWRP